MTRELSFEEFKSEYQNDERQLVQVVDTQTILIFTNSKTSASWGCGPVKGTGWRTLLHPSRRSKQDPRPLFVCTESDYQNAMSTTGSKNDQRND
jgi:hypothetical protein